ncbi:MAG: glycosyltransferase family 39 protein [Caldilineaceae bacterium]
MLPQNPSTSAEIPHNVVFKKGIDWKLIGIAVSVAAIVFIALYNLAAYPTTWFDEGSHLHVPKTLVRFGVYADYSSDGFRYFGPTVGVGPTVMLPIAGMFRLFGIDLWQARLVVAIYLLATIGLLYLLARQLGGRRLALVAVVLLISSRGVALVEYGRQVLGEVPGLFFVVAAFVLWFSAWETASRLRLSLVGVLFGLAMVTKNQYLLILAPALLLSWIENIVYYRSAPQRVFLIPGIVAAGCYAAWQIYMIMYLGPATASENFAMLRSATAGAALVFSPDLMRRSMEELLSIKVYLGALIPILIYGFFVSIPRHRAGQQWGILFTIIAVNFLWYVLASISWLRYAFLGLVLTGLFTARFFSDITDNFTLDRDALWAAIRRGRTFALAETVQWMAMVWLVLMIAAPLTKTVQQIVRPDFNAPLAMATYLNDHVSHDAIIETWEPELGFLTDHNYHFPPPGLLNQAVGYVWLGASSPRNDYDYVETQQPAYVLVGAFSGWVDLYSPVMLAEHYDLVVEIGEYRLYVRKHSS